MMNAYELADIVDRWAYKESAEYLTDAANMLRQQADRMRNLEKTLGFKNSGYETINLTPIPQIKELSDEEIIEIGNAVVNLIDSNEGWIEFAKAILKKASEK